MGISLNGSRIGIFSNSKPLPQTGGAGKFFGPTKGGFYTPQGFSSVMLSARPYAIHVYNALSEEYEWQSAEPCCIAPPTTGEGYDDNQTGFNYNGGGSGFGSGKHSTGELKPCCG
jgi:hypothetical protein|tara:strand:- start:26 stop:370 length:345 start_codon:yes stop_codon:yes gene_type:complete